MNTALLVVRPCCLAATDRHTERACCLLLQSRRRRPKVSKKVGKLPATYTVSHNKGQFSCVLST